MYNLQESYTKIPLIIMHPSLIIMGRSFDGFTLSSFEKENVDKP